METVTDAPLSTLTTMRLGGPAHRVVTISSREELQHVYGELAAMHSPFFVLGGGSNVIARDEGFAGTIILNRIPGFDILDQKDGLATVKIGAGENWDKVVERACRLGLSGIEAMSAIPGTAGATPVQNVGAYGQEIADTLVELEALDTNSGDIVRLSNEDCHFSYRNSIFKDPTTRHHIIISLTLRLRSSHLEPPFYASLQGYLEKHHITDYSPMSIRRAVRAIRANKLPDPDRIANTGSFFKNPIVTAELAARLQYQHPNLPVFDLKDGRKKLAAGWLIEQAGLKGIELQGMKTYEHNALVLVNEYATSYASLVAIRTHIISVVRNKFGVTLEQEPELL